MKQIDTNFKDLEIKDEYRSLHDNVASEFYIPLLSVASGYQRAVGFFSSSILTRIIDGINGLARNGGKIQIIASPYLSEEDFFAIKQGYEVREIIKQAVIKELQEPKDFFDEKRLNILANLIADEVLDIKIAFTENGSSIGMYHEKMGIITDNQGNKVAFSGSMNESEIALIGNYEVIDVWCSWKSAEQQSKVHLKSTAFNSIWNDSEPNVKSFAFPELKKEILDRYMREKINIQDLFDSEQNLNQDTPHIPVGVKLHDYQIQAIEEWERQEFQGIFDMATGTGKTYTGLGAISRLYEVASGKLGVIIVCPYQHLVEQWVEDMIIFGIKPIIGYSSSPQKDWYERLNKAILNHKLSVRAREFFCFICTNATFSSDKVQKALLKVRGDILLLVDEAHNFGAERLSKLLDSRYKYRLALSATIERHNDEEGTIRLFDYFGQKCIEYSLEKAINEGKLTRYKYFPIITYLNDEEMAIYSDLTLEMGRCLIQGKDGKLHLSERGKIIAMNRARLVAGINDKLVKLEEAIKPYVDKRHILVYCGATTILKQDEDSTETSEQEIRQIDAVTDLLGNKLSLLVSQFTSKEDISERTRLKKEFADGKNLQALIAIKCLDEGVNIPAIKTAFILASTTNPKEYIQRRGRVLRLAENKEYAEIFDFLALPRPINEVPSLTEDQVKRELTLVKNELSRADEFAKLAINMAEAERVINSIKDAYSIDDFAIIKEEDFTYD